METIYEAELEAFREHWGQPAHGRKRASPVLRRPGGVGHVAVAGCVGLGDRVAGSVRSFIDAAQNERFGRKRGWVEHISVGAPVARPSDSPAP